MKYLDVEIIIVMANNRTATAITKHSNGTCWLHDL